MVTVTKPVVMSISKRGNAVAVSLPQGVRDRLGWNINDVLLLSVVGKTLVLSKVDLPKVTRTQ